MTDFNENVEFPVSFETFVKTYGTLKGLVTLKGMMDKAKTDVAGKLATAKANHVLTQKREAISLRKRSRPERC